MLFDVGSAVTLVSLSEENTPLNVIGVLTVWPSTLFESVLYLIDPIAGAPDESAFSRCPSVPVGNLIDPVVAMLKLVFVVKFKSSALVKSLFSSTAISSNSTEPVPWALNSKSLLVSVVVIKLSCINTSSDCAALNQAFFQVLLASPKLYAPLISGTISWSISWAKLIVSLASLPNPIALPPIVKSPDITTLPVTFVLSKKFIIPAALSTLILPGLLNNVLFVIIRLPVDAWAPFKILVDPPVVTLIPLSAFTCASVITILDSPLSRSTTNWSPTLKLPRWSVEEK